ncbi:MAG TPA: alanine--tRNA ligase [Halanaerobiales bacterium]|nr:alanine--tRNA ligase [Halanaerobiales bacterium]HPZ63047.1 alanine--tRNA ligase [Halanaerobiales bacterium]HQD04525.1 alanine--tRNA ligase [Halanaerobiales bacterium]
MVMTGDELRKAYLDFFAEKGHLILLSASLIPQNDPSILWINAGMAPFKAYFNGVEEPPRRRIATSQKCIRTNDIENVGRTDRHHTFFEMLGNFSFGDYFKKEAICWSWEFVTEVLKLDKDRLWITVYQDDDEAFNIWRDEVGLPEERIIRMGKKDNFWEIGTGPCGPCSEIHYDRGEEYGTGPEDVIGGEGDRFLEIWNLVFTQFNKTEEGDYIPLPQKNIDTGMGLERVASILQGVDSNFETDLLKPMIDYLVEDSGIKYLQDEDTKVAYRVIADHVRGITMAIFDGALPSNEGRGYVIRRILRRALRYGRKLGYEEPFLYQMVPVVIKTMQGGYPELKEKEEYIQRVIKAEEERFLLTLDQGLHILDGMIAGLKNSGEKLLSGIDAFKLYDTYGFPLDLTRDVLAEEGLAVDEDGFNQEMEKQRERARQAREETGFSATEEERLYRSLLEKFELEFTGYEHIDEKSNIIAIVKDGEEVELAGAGDKVKVVLEKTPFYGESGGQVGDKGILRFADNLATVYDSRNEAGLIVHYVEIERGSFKKGDAVEAKVYADLRQATARNHSATHLLHKALKEVLGDHVSQAGSLVEPDRLRFDFNHFNALSKAELMEIEKKVNKAILANLEVDVTLTDIEQAKAMGAVALFGEKYDDVVRVVSMGDYSRELCGGTHVEATGAIGSFKILNESSIAAGVRRIEAITGEEVLRYLAGQEDKIEKAASLLKTTADNLLDRIEALHAREKELEKEIRLLKERLAGSAIDELLEKVEEVNGIKLLRTEVAGLDNEALLNMTDQLKEKMKSGIIVLASSNNDKAIFVAAVSKDLVAEGYHAGKIIGQVARIAGGGGGGRPDMAQAGARDLTKIQEALDQVVEIIK